MFSEGNQGPGATDEVGAGLTWLLTEGERMKLNVLFRSTGSVVVQRAAAQEFLCEGVGEAFKSRESVYDKMSANVGHPAKETRARHLLVLLLTSVLDRLGIN